MPGLFSFNSQHIFFINLFLFLFVHFPSKGAGVALKWLFELNCPHKADLSDVQKISTFDHCVIHGLIGKFRIFMGEIIFVEASMTAGLEQLDYSLSYL
jgi:hypothetical protein